MTTAELSSASDVFDSVETWKTSPGHPDYEVSDMGRVRCTVGRRAPFFPVVALNMNRPVLRIRSEDRVARVRRVDELVLEAFVGPRPAIDYGPVPTNGDRQDVRLDNLSWVAGAVRPADQVYKGGRKKKKVVKRVMKKPAVVSLPGEIKHGHWLGTGKVVVSIQPNQTVELAVDEAQDHHLIPIQHLDDVIRVLQAAKTIIEG